MNEAHDDASGSGVVATEIRLLEGPNLYFTRPAVKVSLRLGGLLDLDDTVLAERATALRLRAGSPGPAGSEARQRHLLRLVEKVLRRLAQAGGTTRLGVRVRPGGSPDTVVVAFPLNSHDRARALAEQLETLLRRMAAGALSDVDVRAAGAEVRAVPAGSPPQPVRPSVPVIAITGTNGKTTTTRLVAHIGMTAGMRTGWSSTDGVLVQGELIERGDYSGPAGARAVLDADGVELAVLETARGGMLFKGLGVSSNDVSVVTNVSADHLGVQGIETLDQLAEVKAIITKVTRPDGWCVLNGDDPRVWAMRSGASGQPWCFSLNPDSPALREALQEHGRGITILDGDIVVLRPGRGLERLVSVLDVPSTLCGLSEHNTANALAGAAGALGLGIPVEAVVEGLKTFAPDPAHNPGRMNIYTLPLATAAGEVSVILDMAHNEAGLDALLNVATGLRPPGSELLLGLGTGGDRTDEILVNLGEMAGLRADRVHIVHKEHYLRGRTMAELEGFLREGLTRGGVVPLSSSETELEGLQAVLATARDGDVVTIMCHSHRAQLHDWLLAHGGLVDTTADIRRKVVLARGEHELEAEIAAVWRDDDAQRRIAAAAELLQRRPADARLLFESASTYDAAGEEAHAVLLYDRALQAGLREPHRHQALLQKASSLRHLHRYDDALDVLDEAATQRPDSPALACFRALVLHDLGRDDAAVPELLRTVLGHAADADVELYRDALTRFVDQTWPPPLQELRSSPATG
ncbi:tetratricopeptide repeat protein [Luteipulveratus halotolerans]|uniref:Mur ligase n=1 Tax=Luteipulveratus halotolerans TaxID=1631356 RepID=A0A0L6CHX2_9MICO|nr:tetratricopeptide repeat protein [Luteipulveratus halotolerans]KNX37200.1 Mur ligase [Luteipulveratus halotolerans]